MPHNRALRIHNRQTADLIQIHQVNGLSQVASGVVFTTCVFISSTTCITTYSIA